MKTRGFMLDGTNCNATRDFQMHMGRLHIEFEVADGDENILGT